MNSKLCLLLLLAALVLPAVSLAQTTPVIALQNLAHTAESLDKTVPFYRDVIGLQVNAARDPLAQQPQALDEDMSKFTATKGAKFRAATFRIPNANFGFELTEFTGAQWTKAGGTVLTTGGKAIKRANGAGNVFVRDVNGFMWELIQRAAQ
jgi:hypothetical protein